MQTEDELSNYDCTRMSTTDSFCSETSWTTGQLFTVYTVPRHECKRSENEWFRAPLILFGGRSV